MRWRSATSAWKTWRGHSHWWSAWTGEEVSEHRLGACQGWKGSHYEYSEDNKGEFSHVHTSAGSLAVWKKDVK